MQKYKVLAEEGFHVEASGEGETALPAGIRPKNEIVELDPEAEETKASLEAGLIALEEAIPTAIDDGPFLIEVLFDEEATVEQREKVAEGVESILTTLKEDPSEFDGVISLTIKRNS